MEHEHFDVLIVGAGLSGIGAACHLREKCPGRTFAILESRDAIGGTWDLFRYPGIRSDSDMFTLGYSFKPWAAAKAIADGPSILEYVRETAREHGIEDTIRFGHKVLGASWSTADSRWTLDVERDGEVVHLTCGFLLGATGYYRYDEGFTPQFPGVERFAGTLVHPQHWPEDLEWAGKRVVVIGSGATAVTLVPAMAERAAHVTMLQRSPSYVFTLPARDPIADALRKRLPQKTAYSVVRWKNVLAQTAFFNLSRAAPGLVRRLIRAGVARQLPKGYEVDKHFKPAYDPWDQRMCLVPDGDLFKALRDGSASVVTDTIETFTETGLRLTSGQELEADVVVTATGLNLVALGGMQLEVDGRAVPVNETVGYKGLMFTGLPNLAAVIGYTNASWTLKADLTADYVCRLLNHMQAHGYREVRPLAPDDGQPLQPFIDLASGYVLRSLDQFPKQGARAPWRLHQNYARDIRMLRHGPIEDEGLRFSRGGGAAGGADAPDERAEPVAV
ncbi:NAD(P)/FAD-dependent oxidoreductase [Conexibacter sp. SYSU D00693]|uniref:flavin-containing monooxygenase n=1 Tax=Conexibacter sp. SYSU D00693 TaxID=2812560 RepID=UPI00196B55EA|nr:NAD(P)/FAD-dependent oxidoreductase [Conexibacter sp. SYSU D00693]